MPRSWDAVLDGWERHGKRGVSSGVPNNLDLLTKQLIQRLSLSPSPFFYLQKRGLIPYEGDPDVEGRGRRRASRSSLGGWGAGRWARGGKQSADFVREEKERKDDATREGEKRKNIHPSKAGVVPTGDRVSAL